MSPETLERNRASVRAFVTAVNAQAWDRLDAVVDLEVVRHSRAAGSIEVRSRDDLKLFLRAELDTFPDAHEEIEDLVCEGDKVAARHTFSGTQRGALGAYPASGRHLKSTYLAIYRLADGKIVEIWAEWDNLRSLIDLGHIEPPGE